MRHDGVMAGGRRRGSDWGTLAGRTRSQQPADPVAPAPAEARGSVVGRTAGQTVLGERPSRTAPGAAVVSPHPFQVSGKGGPPCPRGRRMDRGRGIAACIPAGPRLPALVVALHMWLLTPEHPDLLVRMVAAGRGNWAAAPARVGARGTGRTLREVVMSRRSAAPMLLRTWPPWARGWLSWWPAWFPVPGRGGSHPSDAQRRAYCNDIDAVGLVDDVGDLRGQCIGFGQVDACAVEVS